MLDLMVKIMLTLWLLTGVLFPSAVLIWPNVNTAPTWAPYVVLVLLATTAVWTVLTAFAGIWL